MNTNQNIVGVATLPSDKTDCRQKASLWMGGVSFQFTRKIQLLQTFKHHIQQPHNVQSKNEPTEGRN